MRFTIDARACIAHPVIAASRALRSPTLRGPFAAVVLLLGGCGHKSTVDPGAPDAARVTSASPPAARGSPTVALDATAGFDACTLGYHGVVLDLGDPSSRARFGGKLEAPPLETIEREGATWARVRARSLSLSYYASADDVRTPKSAAADASTYVELRVRGLAAKTVSVYVDGKALGAASLPKGEAQVVTVRGGSVPLGEGLRDVLLRFSGAPRATTEPLAEIDWVHIGTGDPEPHYAAPTRAETLTSVTVHGDPMQALSLRAPGFARCTGWIPKGATVETSIAMASGGEGDAQVRLLRDRADPVVLGTVHISANDPTPKRVSWPVGDLGGDTGALAAVEFVALGATKGARVLFGEPRVVVPPPPATETVAQVPAKSLVLVVLGELSMHSLSLYGGARPVPELSALAAAGITFDANRATSGLASGSFASMVTGLSARAHTLEDADARLPHSITTIADAARQAGISAAFFTANPTTGAAFGFDRGWSTFESDAPNEEAPATLVFDHAAQWIDSHKSERFLVVIHARGGHPPWDATSDQLKSLEPQGYTGGLDAKHAAELLGRARKVPGSLHWTDADRERAWALYALAVDAHDAAIGRLVQSLRAAGRDADTAIVVTGDVGVNEAAHIPFADTEMLDEASLGTLLVARLPGSVLAGKRVTAPTSGTDLGRTILSTLGLEPPTSFGGVDLLDFARGKSRAGGRPMAATASGRFAVRWDRYVLSGARDRENKLCDLALEPACVTDVRPTYPLALDVLHRAAFDALVGVEPPAPREPAALDSATAAALRAWGR